MQKLKLNNFSLYKSIITSKIHANDQELICKLALITLIAFLIN